ncbi:hypothetical protein HK248_07610, partial [Streptococcus agalactiae]|nr:hypothetical protein [Streptococcus agalactiae]
MDKLQGIDLFLFRAYMEKTESGSVVTAMWVGMTELLVNLVFLFVNVAVLFFSTIMKLLEDFSVYDVYKSSIYDFSKDIWQRLVGGNSGVANNSIIFTLIGLSAIYLFVQWALSRGDFSRKVLHFLMVIGVSFAYFGTINATNGGLYVLDGIRGIAQESVQSFNNVSFQMVEGETIQTTDKFSSSYIEKTSYEAYLYVNTGRIDGKFFNNKTEELEPFPTDKILGTSDKDGNFKAVAPKDRSDKLDFLGDGALEDSERNRWMSAVPDYLFQKLAYALSTLFEALVLPIPYLMIHLIRITAEIVLLLLMLAFPLGIVLSFIPKFQDLMFGFMKAFFVTSTVPAFASLMILMCSITDRLISGGFSNAFLSEDKKESSTNLLMSNLVGAIMSCLIYFLFWKYKGIILSFFAGSYGSTVNGAIDNGMEFAGSGFPNVKDYIKHKK